VPVRRQHDPDEVLGRSEAARARAQQLTDQAQQLAGDIAATEEEMARVHDQIAESGVSRTAAEAKRHAERARAFARHEHHEEESPAEPDQ
jgi:hypothetical protein